MMGYLLLVIILVLTIIRFYKNRALFSKLTKKEWGQYILGMVAAVAIAIFILELKGGRLRLERIMTT